MVDIDENVNEDWRIMFELNRQLRQFLLIWYEEVYKV